MVIISTSALEVSIHAVSPGLCREPARCRRQAPESAARKTGSGLEKKTLAVTVESTVWAKCRVADDDAKRE